MNKLYVGLLLVAMLVPCLGMTGAERKKDKKKAKNEQTAATPKKKPESKYDKLLKKGPVQTAKSDFVTVHKVGQKIYFEYPLKHMGREVLVGSKVKSTSDAMQLFMGFNYGTLHLKFEIRDSSVWAIHPNTAVVRNGMESPELQKGLDLAYAPKFYKSFPVAAYNNDSTAVVFEATNLLKNKDLNPTVGLFLIMNFLKEIPGDFSFGTVKAFEDNISVDVNQNFDNLLSIIIATIPIGTVSATSTISMLLLPEEKMKPRVSDTRVGVFESSHIVGFIPWPKADFGSKDEDGLNTFYLANRWRVEPADKGAWERGELVEVKKPIVWYVDNAFPADWKPAIREGVLVWNRAFEKFGLKNVMQVRDFPTVAEDSTFDPDNLKYSCIRYVPTYTANGMGPSWADPTTGEILNASVIIWEGIATLLNNWRFIQTAQLDERIRGTKKLPKEVMHEAMVYVIAHEIGHTLSLMHNMGASHAYPVDSLRSASFTAKYGTTPSIMDYARNNYVAQPGDKGVKLTPPDLGVYDEYAIKWLYSPVAGNKTMWEEAAVVEKWVDEKAGDPMFRYGKQQFRDVWDPSSLTEDLGDDPIKAGTYGIKNLKYILPNLNEWSGEKDHFARRQSLYSQLANQYLRYLMNVFYQVGGIRLTDVKPGTSGYPSELVSKADQRQAVKWLISELRNSSWIDNKELAKLSAPRQKYSTAAQEMFAKQIHGVWVNRVWISSQLADPKEAYTVKELYADLYAEAFRPTLQGGTLTAFDKSLQNGLLANAKEVVAEKKGGLFGITGDEPVMLYPTLEELRLFGLAPAYLLDRFGIQFEEAEKQGGPGTIAKAIQSKMFTGYNSGMNLKTGNPNEKVAAQLDILKKINTLAKSKMTTAPAADRAHYELLYRETQKALKID